MKRIFGYYITALMLLLILLSCEPEVETDYQAYMLADPDKAVLVLNGHSESISALDISSGTVYNDIQLVGYSGTNSAIPSDIMIYDDYIHVILSGQNSIESYDKSNLDYIDDGRHYFENGYNPMTFIPVSGLSWVFVAGFETDKLQPVNLSVPETDYSFVKCYESVTMPDGANSETQTDTTSGNAVGDNKERSSTGGAVLKNGSSSRLYVTNVRYDSSVLLTDSNGDLAEYSGKNVKAGGYFREATISIFSFNADAMKNGASDSSLDFSLVKEINLEQLYRSAAGEEDYFPGDGLNPQSTFILGGRLNVICTGTNGGSTKYYTSSEYIPDRYSLGDEKPGTNPDDGMIIVLDISDPDDPTYLTHLSIGGSPVGFRESIDSVRKIVYLAGVGGVQSYFYGSSAADYSVSHSSSNMILTASNPDSDYYSGLCYDSEYDVLYISFYTGDMLKSINVSGSSSSPQYSTGGSYSVGDGPGALCLLER